MDISVSQTRITGAIRLGESRMRQGITVGVANDFRRRRIADKVSLVAGLTPCSLRIPVPSFYEELRVLAIRDSLPAGGKNLLQHRLSEDLVGCHSRNAVHARTLRFCRAKSVDRMIRRDVHANGLRKGFRRANGRGHED